MFSVAKFIRQQKWTFFSKLQQINYWLNFFSWNIFHFYKTHNFHNLVVIIVTRKIILRDKITGNFIFSEKLFSGIQWWQLKQLKKIFTSCRPLNFLFSEENDTKLIFFYSHDIFEFIMSTINDLISASRDNFTIASRTCSFMSSLGLGSMWLHMSSMRDLMLFLYSSTFLFPR